MLLASHLLHEVEQICDRVAIIRSGTLLKVGTVAELLRGEQYLDVEVADPARAADVLRPLPFVSGLSVKGRRLQVAAPAERSPDINHAFADQGVYAAEIVRRQSTLEDVFLELTETPEGDATTDGEGELERTERDARHVA